MQFRPRFPGPDYILLVMASLVFSFFPGLDIAFSRLFFDPGTGTFFLRNFLLVDAVYYATPFVMVFAAVLVVARFIRGLRNGQTKRSLLAGLFIVCVYLLGPGLVVNAILKDHTHRARPHQVEEFGGGLVFTPPFVISDQCRKNCSFVSGHASVGFSLSAFAFVMPAYRTFWIVTGIATGAFIGLVRIAQGGHFLSDVVFSGLFVWFTILALRHLFSLWGMDHDRAVGGSGTRSAPSAHTGRT